MKDQENKEFHLLANLVVQPDVPIVIVKDIIVGLVSKARFEQLMKMRTLSLSLLCIHV